jgi:hypothetical protein
MSQPDYLHELRAAKPIAPSELRERVRLVAAQAPPHDPHRRWRRALYVGVPVVAAAIAAAVFIPRHPSQQAVRPPIALQPLTKQIVGAAASGRPSTPFSSSIAQLPAPSTTRLQRYSASLSLQVKNNAAVSEASKQAVAITHALGGYQQTIDVTADTGTGYANLELKVPKPHVTEAVRRMSTLGTILSESVSAQDLQAGYNATTRTIARLQSQLAALRAQTQTKRTAIQIEQVTVHIQSLQRQNAATVRTAHYATVDLQLTTKAPVIKHHKPGPLHGLVTAFRWIGIGLVYALALGTPLALLGVLLWLGVRTVRRRREAALLSRA